MNQRTCHCGRRENDGIAKAIARPLGLIHPPGWGDFPVPPMGKFLQWACWFLVTSAVLLGKSSVWKVGNGTNYLYIGGTIHMLRDSDYPLPAEFPAAYKDADTLVFETDVGKMEDPATNTKIMAAGRLEGQTLQDVLSPGIYLALVDYCSAVGIDIRILQRLKPSLAMMVVSVAEMQRMGVTRSGVDMHMYNYGTKDRKKIQILETVDEQIGFLTSMGEGNQDEYVANWLRDMELLRTQLPLLVDAWRKGDRTALATNFLEDLQKDYPRLYKSLLVNRNRAWMPKILPMLKTPEKEFVLVGAGHLVGADGILAKLEGLGYKVEQIETGQSSAPAPEGKNGREGEIGFQIVPVADFPRAIATKLERDLEAELGMEVAVSPPMQVTMGVLSRKKGQLLPSGLARKALEMAAGQESQQETPYLVVLTNYDLNEPMSDFSYLYSEDYPGVSVISTARLDPGAYGYEPDSDLLYQRLNKMVKRGLGRGLLGIPSSSDWGSVMYSPMEGLDDLDKMGMHFPLDKEKALEFFKRYQTLTKSWDPALATMYSDDARVIIHQNKPDGKASNVLYTGTEWKSKLPGEVAGMKDKGKANQFGFVHVYIEGAGAKVTANRYTSDGSSVDAGYYMKIARQEDGRLAITEEYFETRANALPPKAKPSALENFLGVYQKRVQDHLPLMVDANTRLDAVEVRGRSLVFLHTMVNLSRGQVAPAAFQKQVKEPLAKQVCANPELSAILKKGARLAYVYRFNDGSSLAVVRLDSSACGL